MDKGWVSVTEVPYMCGRAMPQGKASLNIEKFRSRSIVTGQPVWSLWDQLLRVIGFQPKSQTRRQKTIVY